MSFKIEDAKCIAETDRAILVEALCFDDPTWIPLSQVVADSEVWNKDDEGICEVSDWLASRLGLD